MADTAQQTLLEIPEQPERESKPEGSGQLKLYIPNRQQIAWAAVDVDRLIPMTHKARAILALVSRLPLQGFHEGLKTQAGSAGAPAWDPQLLVSVWVYAYSEGITSAREISRRMSWEPALQWLCGLETINAHSLSDFRVKHKDALDNLFAELLALLESEGLVDLSQIAHDGTKIRAQAGADTFRREKTLKQRLEEARAVVKQMPDPNEEGADLNKREAAQARASREQLERLETAAKELEKLQENKPEEEKGEVRVSLTEPEARVMKHGDNALAPSYNAQISTSTEGKIIVGAHLSQCSSDAHSLMPAMKQVEENLGGKPEQVIVDGGFTIRQNIIECAEQGIDLVGSLPDAQERSDASMKAQGIDVAFGPQHFQILGESKALQCPAGCRLEYARRTSSRGNVYEEYRASAADCMACRFQPQCCPKATKRGRSVSLLVEEQVEVSAFRKKMKLPEYQVAYRLRGAVAEFPNAWIKEKLKLRKFRVRGLKKAESELKWACLTYNIMQWVRLSWLPALAT